MKIGIGIQLEDGRVLRVTCEPDGEFSEEEIKILQQSVSKGAVAMKDAFRAGCDFAREFEMKYGHWLYGVPA